MSASSTSAGGSPANGCSRSSGGHHGMPSASYTDSLVGRVGERLERRDVGRRAGRADQRGPEPLGLGGDELDRHPLDRDPDRAPVAALEQRDDLRQRGEAIEHRLGLGRGADDRQPLARVAPAADVARGLAAERDRDRADQLAGAVEQKSLPGSRLLLARERLEQQRLGLGADPGHVAQPPRRGGLAELVGGAHAERPRELDRALGARARGSGRGRRGRATARARARRARRSARSRSARAAAPRFPAPIPRSSRTRLRPHEVRDRERRRSRIVSAARR